MNKYDDILRCAEEEMMKLNHPYVGTEHLLLAILKSKNELTEFLKTKKLTYKRFKTKLINVMGIDDKKTNFILYTPLLRNVLKRSEEEAISRKVDVDEVILFSAILDSSEGVAIRVINELGIDYKDLYYINNVKFKDGIILNDVVVDDIVVGRDKELKEIIQILLRKNKCNPLLIGKAGVGKSAIVEELARRIKKGEVPRELLNTKILKIDFSNLVAGTKYRGDFEDKVTNLIKEVIKCGNVILFVDEAHTLVNAGGADGAIGAGDIFKPFLARGELKVIGATTSNEYHKFICDDKALARRFQTVLVLEPTYEETKTILFKAKETYEKYHKVKYSDEVILEILDATNNYLKNKANPDKAIELMDSVGSFVKYDGREVVLVDDIYKLLEERYKVSYLRNNVDEEIESCLEDKVGIITTEPRLLTQRLEKMYNSSLFLNIDVIDYNTDYGSYKLLGFPNESNKDYVFRRFIDNPFGVIWLKNLGANMKNYDIFWKMIEKRLVVDNFGNEIDLRNCLIVLEEYKNNKGVIGFFKSSSSFRDLEKYFRRVDVKKDVCKSV